MCPGRGPKAPGQEEPWAGALTGKNEHLAYTKPLFLRVQGPKNTPKVNQKRSKGPSKIALIVASIFGLFFY